jgi:hypothetical protein
LDRPVTQARLLMLLPVLDVPPSDGRMSME